MAVFKREDTVSSHNYISPVFTDLFTEEERMSHMWCRISAFYRHHFISSKDISTKCCFLYLLELQAMKPNLNYS